MKLRQMALDFAIMTSSVFAGHMTITSYGVPRTYPFSPKDTVTFDPYCLNAIVTSPGAPDPVVNTYYLGYENCVTFDTVGGAPTVLYINKSDGTQQAVDFASIDSVVIVPRVNNPDGLAAGCSLISNFQALLQCGFDPNDTDNDGDGFLNQMEQLESDPQVWSPLVANLPMFDVQMTTYPTIWLVTSSSSTRSTQNTISQGTDCSSSTTLSSSSTNTNSMNTSLSLSLANEVSAGNELGILPKIDDKFTTTLTSQTSYGHEWTTEVSAQRSSSISQTLENAQTLAKEENITYTGANLMVNVKVTNINPHVAMTMISPSFMLCGIRMSHGQAIQDTLFTLDVAGAQSATPIQVPAGGVILTLQPAQGVLTLGQVTQLNSYCFLKVVANSLNISYQVSGTSSTLQLNTMLASVGRKTARITVDFDHCLNGQEDPFIRSVATLTQPNPANIAFPETYHGPMFLGELLHNMGLTYVADSTGFVSINGLKRDSNNIWMTQIIREATLGGLKSNTIEIRMGKGSGPDAVIKTGDQVFLSFSGDDDRDSVPNCVAKMYGIYATADHPSKTPHDFDGDGVSNYREIYGWVSSGGDTVCTDPAHADCDGDGITDGLDPHPLVPRLAAAANLLTFGIYGDVKDSALVQSIAFDTAHTGVITDNIPCFPHFFLTVDTPAVWVKVKMSNGDSLILSDTLWSDSDKTTHAVTKHFGYTDCFWKAARNPLPLGPVTITVITMPLNKSVTKSWTMTGNSSMQNLFGSPAASSSPVSTTTDGGQWWQQLKVTVSNVAHQAGMDPRITGYLVFRSSSTGTFDVTSQHGDVSGNSQNGWIACKNITDLSRDTTFYDAGLASGTTYFYRVIPYNKSGATFTYGATAAADYSPGASTWHIWVNVNWSYWRCDLSNFSSDVNAQWDVTFANPNGNSGRIGQHENAQFNSCGNGANYTLGWNESAEVHLHDSISTNIGLQNYTNQGNPVNGNIMDMCVDHFLTVNLTASAVNVFSGGVVTDGSTCTNISWVNHIAVPNASGKNSVTFGSVEHTDDSWGAGTWGSELGLMGFQWWFVN